MTPIDCVTYEQWLDAGADPALAAAMDAHASGCLRCTAARNAMAEVDALFVAAPAAPRGFTDAIMARVARLPDPRTSAATDEMPWWLGIFQQPAVVLAALVAAILLWKADALVAGAAIGASALAGTSIAVAAQLSAWGSAPAMPAAFAAWAPGSAPLLNMGLALGLAPVLAYGSLALAGWVARSVERATQPR